MFRDGEAIERAIDIARALGLDDVIVRLPNGLNTRIGDGTVEALPNGVRQRIAMARALVGDPPIILFDDANGTLDQRSDDLLRDLLLRFKGNRTMVVISHRPSFLSLCDRCYRIAGGELQPMEVPTSGGPTAQPSLPQPQPAALSMHGAD
jgi:ATP-binding cassette subfamily C protein LapB